MGPGSPGQPPVPNHASPHFLDWSFQTGVGIGGRYWVWGLWDYRICSWLHNIATCLTGFKKPTATLRELPWSQGHSVEVGRSASPIANKKLKHSGQRSARTRTLPEPPELRSRPFPSWSSDKPRLPALGSPAEDPAKLCPDPRTLKLS